MGKFPRFRERQGNRKRHPARSGGIALGMPFPEARIAYSFAESPAPTLLPSLSMRASFRDRGSPRYRPTARLAPPATLYSRQVTLAQGAQLPACAPFPFLDAMNLSAWGHRRTRVRA